MRRIFTLILALLLYVPLLAQTINVSGYTVKRELPGDVSLWAGNAASAVAQSSSKQGGQEAKMVITIERSGAKICGNSPQTASLEGVTTKAITTGVIKGVVDNCVLQPGTYSLCIEFFNADNQSVSKKQCREFSVVPVNTVDNTGTQASNPLDPDTLPGTITTPKNPGAPKRYQGPQLISPANKTEFRQNDLRKPLTLRWTPVVPPPPPNDITYTLRIYAVEKGQEPGQAARANQPIIEKELKTTQATWQVPQEYLTDRWGEEVFAWQVQATNKEGKPYGENNGMSQVWSYRMSSYTIGLQTDSFIVSCTNIPGKYSFKFCVRNITTANSSSTPIAVNLTSLSVNSAIPTSTNTITGAIPSTIAASASICITGTITSSIPNLNSITLKYTIEDPNMPGRIAADFATATVPQCSFSCCQDVIKSIMQNANSGIGTPLINITMKAGPKPMKKVQMDLVYVKATTNDNCPICKNRWQWWGNIFYFEPPQLPGFGAASGGLAQNLGHELTWTSNTGVDMYNTPRTTNIVMLLQTAFEEPFSSCCHTDYEYCIRYSFTDTSCVTCDTLICSRINFSDTHSNGGGKSATNSQMDSAKTLEALKKEFPAMIISDDKTKKGTPKQK